MNLHAHRTSTLVSPLPIPDLSSRHESGEQAVAHAISTLSWALSRHRYAPRDGQRIYLELRRDLPYVLEELPDADNYIIVNRNYKPVGSTVCEVWVDYAAFPQAHVRLIAAQVAEIACPGYPVALFGDHCPPWRSRQDAEAYLSRLRRLHQHLSS